MLQPISSIRTITLITTTLSSFLVTFMVSAMTVALPSIGKEFQLNAGLLGWMMTVYLLATAIFVVPFGKMGDLYGRKRMFLYGLAVYTVASLLAGFASSAAFLIGLRIVQGIGAAMIFSNSVAMLTSVFPPQQRGRVLGINLAATYTGLSTGPLLGGLLTQYAGWRSIFWVNAVCGGLTLAVVLWQLHDEWAEAHGETFDWLGSILAGIMLLALTVGLQKLPGMRGIIFIIVGIATLSIFVWWELRVPHPVLSMNLFLANRGFAFSNLAALIHYSATYALSFLLSLYLQYLKNLPPQQAGLVLIAQPVMMAIFSPWAGRLSDRIESRILASVGMSVTTIGLVVFTGLQAQTPIWLIVLNLLFLGAGFAFFSSPNTHAIMSAVERRFYGVASGTLATMRTTGQALSMGMVMMVFSLHQINQTQMTPTVYSDFLSSVRTIFGVCGVLCFFGIFASLARGKQKDSPA